MASFVLSFFPLDVLDEILNLIESVSEGFPSYFCIILSCTCIIDYLSYCNFILSESKLLKFSLHLSD